MDASIVLGIIVAVVAFSHLAIAVYTRLISPRLRPKPDIAYSADHYFISDEVAAHDITIVNRGRGIAHDIGFYMQFKSPYTIIDVTSEPPSDIVKGGKGSPSVECLWATLVPNNFISLRAISSADKRDPKSTFPLEIKLWDKERLISRFYTP